jgi:hypothetical protein
MTTRAPGPSVLLGIGGGIAAYKLAYAASRLVQLGCRVRVAMTPHATSYVGALTFEGLTGKKAILSSTQVDPDGGVPHIEAAAAAEVYVIAPATADLLARLAHGAGSDAVSLLALTCRCPILVCPAMNDRMWTRRGAGERRAAARARLPLPRPGRGPSRRGLRRRRPHGRARGDRRARAGTRPGLRVSDTPGMRAFVVRGAAIAEALDWLHVHADLQGVLEQDDAITVWLVGDLPRPPVAGLSIEELAIDPADHAITGLEHDTAILVAADLLVRPPWVERPVGSTGLELVVPRGGAFGSGEHDSTQAALRCLHRVWDAPPSFADIGTGSGILLLYAQQRGCARVGGLRHRRGFGRCRARTAARSSAAPRRPRRPAAVRRGRRQHDRQRTAPRRCRRSCAAGPVGRRWC